jgi:hypothetical protein
VEKNQHWEIGPMVEGSAGVVNEVRANGMVLVEVKARRSQGWGRLLAMRCSATDI